MFGAISIVGGCLALPLPETRHRPLPDTVEDVEHYEDFCKKSRHHDVTTPNGNEMNVIGRNEGTKL